jgi:predicted acylesterase/phospholipase RssA
VKRAFVALFGATALAGCVTAARLDWPAAQPAGQAMLPDIPYPVRIVNPSYDEFHALYEERIAMARSTVRDGSLDILALSGGGAGGVFGAGAMAGFTHSGKRPTFEIVTGISTGSLIAPFAFLGPEWDQKLEEGYTGGKSASLVTTAGVGSLFRVGVFKGDALRELVSEFVTPELIEAVARESATGRALLVATTDLDTEQPVYWDMGAIAARGGDEARELFINVLVASSSVPGAFPPVMIPVEGPAGKYDEMHVDGGVTVPFFIAPEVAFMADGVFPGLRGANVYVVINGQLESTPRITPPNTISMVMRSSNVAMMRMARSEMLLAAGYARRNRMKFHFTYLPGTYPFAGSLNFEQASMRQLFDYAEACAEKGELWLTDRDALEKSGKALVYPEGDAATCPAAAPQPAPPDETPTASEAVN